MTDLVVRTKLAKYLALRDEANALKKEMEDVKAEMKPYLDKARENAAGSKVLELDSPLRNGDKDYSAVQYTRKVKRTLNEERALEFLKSDQAFEIAIIQTEHVDQDALWDLFVNELISEETLNSFFDETITWAFTPIAE